MGVEEIQRQRWAQNWMEAKWVEERRDGDHISWQAREGTDSAGSNNAESES